MNTDINPVNMTVKLPRTEEIVPIVIGMPATWHIGSDSYARTIAEIHTFKTGAKKGQLKGVVDNRGHYYRLNKWNILKEEGRKYGGLGLGYAIDRLDPHF